MANTITIRLSSPIAVWYYIAWVENSVEMRQGIRGSNELKNRLVWLWKGRIAQTSVV